MNDVNQHAWDEAIETEDNIKWAGLTLGGKQDGGGLRNGNNCLTTLYQTTGNMGKLDSQRWRKTTCKFSNVNITHAFLGAGLFSSSCSSWLSSPSLFLAFLRDFFSLSNT